MACGPKGNAAGRAGISVGFELESGSDPRGRRSRQAGPPWQRDREGEGALGRKRAGSGDRAGGEKLLGWKRAAGKSFWAAG